MKSLVTSLRSRYAKLTRRERGLAVMAALALVAGVGGLFFIEPSLKQRALLERQIGTQQKERATLEQAMTGARSDPNAALKTQLAALQTQLRATDREFGEMRNGLVQPQHMGALLQSILTEHRGLQLLGLRSLPVTAVGGQTANAAKKTDAGAQRVSAASAASADSAASATSAVAAAAPDDAWLYKHGVEIRVQGNYADMLAYLQALEDLPRRVYWGDVEIDARHYPANVMTVTMFTISLEKSWWVL